MRVDEASTASFRASNWCATRASDRGQGKSLNSKEISAAKARHHSTKCQTLQSLGHFCQHVRHSVVRISTACLAYQPGLAPRNNIWLARPRFVHVAHPRLHPIVIAVFVVPAIASKQMRRYTPPAAAALHLCGIRIAPSHPR